MISKMSDIFVMGQSIYDFIYEIKDHKEMEILISRFNIKEGYSQLTDKDTIEYLLKNFTPIVKEPAGTANNTAAGLAMLGAKVTVTQVVGDDTLGSMYISKMDKYGVKSLTVKSSLDTTGVVVVIISHKLDENGNKIIIRTMIVYPGISAHGGLYDVVNKEVINNHKVVFTEGYMWKFAPNKIKQIIKDAKENGSCVAFTFGDKYIVNLYKEEFVYLIKNIDLVFADSEQILELYDETDLEIVMAKLQKNPGITIITMAEKGAYIVGNGEVLYIPVYKVEKIVDSTGAGDQFAAGFLYGYIKGLSLMECGNLGALQAAKIIQKIGAR
jgi:sugar/nucleoside kinase (ribokinase family)